MRRVFRRAISRPIQFVPTAEGFGAAVRAGLGWGMYPERLTAPRLADGCSYGSPMRTSTYRCSGSAGSSTAQWSSASPRRSGRPLPKVVRAVAAVLETLSPDLHDDLSPCPPRLDVGQSFRDRFEWEDPIDNGLYNTRVDEKT